MTSRRRKKKQQIPTPQLTEKLEQRTMLTVSSLFIANSLTIESSDGADDISVSADMSSNIVVTVNGNPDLTLPVIAASALQTLVIVGSDDDNVIDVSGVTVADFSFIDPTTGAGLQIGIDAGDGDDTIMSSPDIGVDIDAGDGNDTITAGDAGDTIDAGDGDDSVDGGAGNDNIKAGDGQDIVRGLAGDDTIDAGNGDDSVNGNDGVDSLTGGHGTDTLAGDDGNDFVDGGFGNDSLDGNDGVDTLIGNVGDDTANGGLGDDSIDGQAGNDVLFGNEGNDSIRGGKKVDNIDGGVGDDFIIGDQGNDIVLGGDGNDTLLGGGGSDALNGGTGDDLMFGQAGRDSLSGGVGSDQLFGGTGNDFLEAGEPELSVDDVTIDPEGDTGSQNAVFTVQLSSASTQTVTFRFTTSDGTADLSDYQMVDTIVTFLPGDTVQTVSVPVFGDLTIEGAETFFVNLSSAVNASVFDGLGQGTIIDDDNPVLGVTIGTNFTGSDSTQSPFNPPDTMGTVGPNHIVELLNGRFAIYDKANGALLQSSTLDAFFQSAGVPGPFGTFDPRIIFDPTSNRYFATAIDGPNPGNSLFLAVSISADPTAGFRGLRFVADSSGNAFNDYQTMSVDADGLYIATSNFITGGGFDVSIYSIPKADLLLATPSVANLTRFESLNAGQFGSAIQASLDFGPSDGRAALLSVTSTGGGNTLTRTNIIGAGGPGATLQPPTNIIVPNYQPGPPGDQPGGATPLENVSPRFTGNVFEQGDSLWGTHAVLDTVTMNSAIRWYEIDETTNAVLQTGLISDVNLDFLDPSIAVNQFGAVVIGATGTGPNTFPSTFAFAGQTTMGVTTFGLPMLLQSGTDSFDQGGFRNRWGDYSATVLDPSNPFSFWTFQEFAVNATTWGIQATQILIGTVAPPPPPPPPSPTGTSNDTLDGGSGNDTLIGGDGDDLILGSVGDDLVQTGGGNDFLQGGGGNDTLDGGGGDDTIVGHGGADLLIGGEGNDEYIWRGVGDGNDTLQADLGNDLLSVNLNSASNTLNIGQSADGDLTVNESNRTITVNPFIQGGVVELEVNGNQGDDVINIGDVNLIGLTSFTINGESGNDTILATNANLGRVRLTMNGGDGNDFFTGSASGETIMGGQGADIINGGDGNDNLQGGDDDDILNGNDGNDTIDGGVGDDMLNGNDGDDMLLGGFDDDSLDGNDGNDSLIGGFGDDFLNGNFGNDSLLGNSGEDTLVGAAGADTLDGGRNNDILLGNSGNDKLRGNDGDDFIRGQGGDDTIDAGDGNDTVMGEAGNDGIAAGDGNDFVDAGIGNDTVTGGDGDDTLLGGGGRDIVSGGDGDDFFIGNSGFDTLLGGEGNDIDDVADNSAELDEAFVFTLEILANLDAS